MNNLSSPVNNVEWRRSKVSELSSQGYNQSEISRILQISQIFELYLTFLNTSARRQDADMETNTENWRN
jgi:hypothetical protein